MHRLFFKKKIIQIIKAVHYKMVQFKIFSQSQKSDFLLFNENWPRYSVAFRSKVLQ